MVRGLWSVVFLWSVVCGLSTVLYAATLKGRVVVEGSVPQNPKISMGADPACSSMHSGAVYAEKVVLNADQSLQNVFVYVKGEVPRQMGSSECCSCVGSKGMYV